MPLEFRVVWQREGRQRATRVYQTGVAAHRKAMGILALERAKTETRFAAMPDLVDRPVIETRQVGEWAPDEAYALPEPTGALVERMRTWAAPEQGDDGYGPF